MIVLKDTETDASLGTISAEQLRFLRAELVKEDEDDQDYWIDRDTLELLRDHGGDPGLLSLIELGMAGREGIEIAWIEGQPPGGVES